MKARLLSVCFSLVVVAGCSASSVATVHSGPSAGAIPELTHLDQLRAIFNQHTGVPRLILLASPTCPTCVVGSSWVREHVLAAHPNAKLTVIVLWEPMYPGDSYAGIDRTMFADRRAINLWDPHEISGRWFGTFAGGGGGTVAWDRFYGYSADARWTTAPSGLVVTGHPIIGATSDLERAFLPLLA